MPKLKTKEEVEKKADAIVGVTELHVYDRKGTYARTYSAVDQGLNFPALAESYAKKIGGTVEKYRK